MFEDWIEICQAVFSSACCPKAQVFHVCRYVWRWIKFVERLDKDLKFIKCASYFAVTSFLLFARNVKDVHAPWQRDAEYAHCCCQTVSDGIQICRCILGRVRQCGHNPDTWILGAFQGWHCYLLWNQQDSSHHHQPNSCCWDSRLETQILRYWPEKIMLQNIWAAHIHRKEYFLGSIWCLISSFVVKSPDWLNSYSSLAGSRADGSNMSCKDWLALQLTFCQHSQLNSFDPGLKRADRLLKLSILYYTLWKR